MLQFCLQRRHYAVQLVVLRAHTGDADPRL
jgi:hypothetical protein